RRGWPSSTSSDTPKRKRPVHKRLRPAMPARSAACGVLVVAASTDAPSSCVLASDASDSPWTERTFMDRALTPRCRLDRGDQPQVTTIAPAGGRPDAGGVVVAHRRAPAGRGHLRRGDGPDAQ